MKLIVMTNPRPRSKDGSAVIIMMAMLGIMMVFVAANTVAIRSLGREIKLVDQKQIRHWQETTKGAKSSIQPANSLEKTTLP